MFRRFGGPGMHGIGGIPLSSLGPSGAGGASPFVGAYDAIANLVHVYEPARCTLSAYTGGNLLKLRRASDDAEWDFSHVSATDPELDLAAIAAWAGGASYIVSVYDQKTGDTITQATKANQPLFTANAQNGHAGATLNGTTQYWQGPFTIGGALSLPFTYYSVALLDPTVVDDGKFRVLFDGDDVANRAALQQFAAVPDVWAIAGSAALQGDATSTGWYLWAALFNGAASQFWRNGVSVATGNTGTGAPDGITIGCYPTYNVNYVWKGSWVSTVICDPSHSDAQRVAMQTAMNSYWAVY